MVYCSNCGSPLPPSARFCSRCGFEIPEEKSNSISDDVLEAEVLNDEEIIASDVQKDSAPAVDRICIECDEEASQKCYFCWANICMDHTYRMQIFINKAPFGNQVVSCRKCANDRNNKQPTQSEAEGASLFFGVKPYHEWKIVK